MKPNNFSIGAAKSILFSTTLGALLYHSSTPIKPLTPPPQITYVATKIKEQIQHATHMENNTSTLLDPNEEHYVIEKILKQHHYIYKKINTSVHTIEHLTVDSITHTIVPYSIQSLENTHQDTEIILNYRITLHFMDKKIISEFSMPLFMD